MFNGQQDHVLSFPHYQRMCIFIRNYMSFSLESDDIPRHGNRAYFSNSYEYAVLSDKHGVLKSANHLFIYLLLLSQSYIV